MSKKSLWISTKTSYLALFFFATFLLGFGYFLEFYHHIAPCPLCMTQRICFYLIALLSLVALIRINHKAWCKNIFTLLTVIAAIGAVVASRQIWLQNLPKDQVPACGPDLSYLISEFPLSEVLLAMFTGDGNCAEVVWTFLGLSIPSWSFMAFVFVAAFCLYQRVKAD